MQRKISSLVTKYQTIIDSLEKEEGILKSSVAKKESLKIKCDQEKGRLDRIFPEIQICKNIVSDLNQLLN